MRIISKHHDYYDNALAQGQDRSLVYLRENLEFRTDNLKGVKADLVTFIEYADKHRPNAYSLNDNSKKYRNTRIHFGVVLFCGRLVPFAEITRTLKGEISAQGSYFTYDVAEVARVLDEHEIDIDDTSRKSHSYEFAQYGKSVTAKGFFEELDGNDRFMDLAITNRLAVASLLHSTASVDPILDRIQFYRKFAHAQAFQELSMFFGNLAAPDRVPVQIEDKHRIPQHGFDRYSFRKRPQNA